MFWTSAAVFGRLPRDDRQRSPVTPEDRERIEGGEVYHWKNGEGILFDDTYLHDAKNDSDEVRVVLWLDVRKKWPLVPHWLNVLFLKIAFADASVKRIRKNAVVRS